ncbi:MAG: 30S ribosomal protein S6 [Planctomycetaceae bacterium]
MAEYLYEGMFLLDSAAFAADHEGTVNKVLNILESAGAQVDAHRPWQDGRLAYEIDGHKKGLHYLVLFRLDGAALATVTRQCKLSDGIIRQLILKHPRVLYDAIFETLSGHEIQSGDVEETNHTEDDEISSEEMSEEAEVASSAE